MIIIVMGVSGSGKTTVGGLLAERLGWIFADGDTFHPQANLSRMASGIPLTDADRTAWLEALAGFIRVQAARGQNCVIACSALKQRYRSLLTNPGMGQVRFVYLLGSYPVILECMRARGGHFMKPAMLQSQFADLQEPVGALTIDIRLKPEQIVKKIVEQIMEKRYALGIVGVGVMGRALALNFTRHGFLPLGYVRPPRTTEDPEIDLTNSLEAMAAALTQPRTVLLMVPAGGAVPSVVASLQPYLQPGDLIIDGGNSHYLDTAQRVKELKESGIHFIGMGVSGGEQGALWGPSLMPGGSAEAWPGVRTMFEAIAARAEDGQPCVAWMGPDGAGHYVKMVHNGIEYADMQLIAEVYDLLHRGAGMSNSELAGLFERWNQGPLRSYLVEITAKILAWKDEFTGRDLVDLIVDEAAQKGTGKWTSLSALDSGSAIPTINAAVESRVLSALKDERLSAARVLGSPAGYSGDVQALAEAAGQALYTSKVTVYAQGFNLLRAASRDYDWNLDLAGIAPVWRAGCIIRAALLEDITRAYRRRPDLANLLLDEDVSREVLSREAAWRTFVQAGVASGIPVPALSASLAYFDTYRSAGLPANLTQAQRDYFGAHTYRRVDREGSFHTLWEG